MVRGDLLPVLPFLGNRTPHSQQANSRGNCEVWRLHSAHCSPREMQSFQVPSWFLSGCPVVSFVGPTHTPFLKSAISRGLAFSPILSSPLLGDLMLLVTMCPGSPLAGGGTHCIIVQRQSEDGFCHISGTGTISSPERWCGPITRPHLNRVLYMNPQHSNHHRLSQA